MFFNKLKTKPCILNKQENQLKVSLVLTQGRSSISTRLFLYFYIFYIKVKECLFKITLKGFFTFSFAKLTFILFLLLQLAFGIWHLAFGIWHLAFDYEQEKIQRIIKSRSSKATFAFYPPTDSKSKEAQAIVCILILF